MPLIKLLTLIPAVVVTSILLGVTVVFAAPVPVETSILDRSLRSETQYGVGITMSVAQRPFVGVDDQSTSLPYIVFNYEDIHVEGLNISYNIFDNQKFNVDLLATPRFYEVKASFADNGELDGIDETKPTYFAGLSAQYRAKPATVTLQLFYDLFESDGAEFVASVSKAINSDGAFTFAPALGVTYQDSRLVDHFYGVQANEVKVNRPQYGGNSSTNYHVSLTGIWQTTKHIQLIGQIKYEALGNGTTNSPIVDEDKIITTVAGIVYRF